MKSFFPHGIDDPKAFDRPGPASDAPVAAPLPVRVPRPARGSRWHARLAVYDTLAAAPRTLDISSSEEGELVEEISSRVYALATGLGGSIPYTVIREVSENFIHADFSEPVISVLDDGDTIRFADQGPGIRDKERAVLPGFTTATRTMKGLIRGVGSGLPIVREYMVHTGGSLSIDDNLGSGTVVTISRPARASAPAPDSSSPGAAPDTPGAVTPSAEAEGRAPLSGFPPLSTRQKQVLSLVLEIGQAGPTLVSKELSIALSTAHRDLAYLEHVGLIASDETGKRVLTGEGSAYLDCLFSL